jgi:hypothetical protein
MRRPRLVLSFHILIFGRLLLGTISPLFVGKPNGFEKCSIVCLKDQSGGDDSKRQGKCRALCSFIEKDGL